MDKKVIATSAAPAAVGPYSQAIKAGGFLFLSGQLPLDPKTSTITSTEIEGQTRQALTNIKSILASEGLTLANIVKTTVFMKDIADFAKMNGVYKDFFTVDAPARSTFQVANLPMNALVEIESIAVLK